LWLGLHLAAVYGTLVDPGRRVREPAAASMQ